MLRVTKFYVRSFDLDHLNIFWEVENTQDNIRAFEFYLSKCESPAGPFVAWTGPFEDQYFIRDTLAPQEHKARKIFYKLKIRDKRTDETIEHGPTAPIPEPDLIALEIVRQEDLLFREFIGTRVVIFPAKTFGQFCLCINKVTKRSDRAFCMSCYGTGFLGGYNSPIACYIQIDPHTKTTQSQPMIEQNPVNSTARLINFPPINEKDIIIDSENRRWEVISTHSTKKLGYPVHQELSIKELLRSDPTHKLPVSEADITTLEIAAERNFTNPQTLQKDAKTNYSNKPRGVY